MVRILPENLAKTIQKSHGLIQVLSGPRQVGKTTAARALFDPAHTLFASADLPTPPTPEFIIENWQKARNIKSPRRTLVLDEVQKIPRWSEVVKGLWDEDKAQGLKLDVCLLGSSAILMEKGLSESLTGRFEVHTFPHWTYAECRKVFGATLAEYATTGGYPKAYDFRGERERLENYLQDGIIEPSLGRDILSLHAVDKPALLRQLFWYVSRLPAHIVSYQKILDHLQGRGNAATLVHYADLLRLAFLVCPLNKYSPKIYRTKKSIPKWILPNPSLVNQTVRSEGLKNFSFENLIGSHLLNILFGKRHWELTYWRDDNEEIDFILTHEGVAVLAIEVKSGRKKPPISPTVLEHAGIQGCKTLVVTPENTEEFLMNLSAKAYFS